VHAAASDFPIGFWAAAQVLDVVAIFGKKPVDRFVGRSGLLGLRRSGSERAADRLVGLGLATASMVAVFGIADWAWLRGKPRRLGLAHALTNVAITGLYAASLFARKAGRRRLGFGLSTVGFGLLGFSAWLGGEMVYRHGVGVSRNAFREESAEWTDVGLVGLVHEGELRRVDAAGRPVLLARHRGSLRAIGDTCSHLGCSLSKGRLEGDRVVCSCHGSQFRITDGKVLAGPASVSQPAYEVRERSGRVEVRNADPSTRGMTEGDGATGRPSFA
jgi:nitrite reductase/ring-hydroxylating ferredoxin subunit/uncharacterized membrane protein